MGGRAAGTGLWRSAVGEGEAHSTCASGTGPADAERAMVRVCPLVARLSQVNLERRLILGSRGSQGKLGVPNRTVCATTGGNQKSESVSRQTRVGWAVALESVSQCQNGRFR
jgi:hypothetical protein